MKCTNIQFGEFEYSTEHELHFPEGLIGFEGLHKFILINDEESQPFFWLVSLEDSEVSFPVIDPQTILPEYHVPIKDESNVTVLVLASFRERPEDAMVNLRSPIVIENKTQQGKQIVLEDETIRYQQPLFVLQTESVKG